MSSSRPSEPSFYSTTREHDRDGAPATEGASYGRSTTERHDEPAWERTPGAARTGEVPLETSGPDAAVREADPRRWQRALGILGRPSSWTLRSRLVVSMVALFTFVTLLSGAATTVALRGFLYGQLDDQLMMSLQRPTPVGGDNGCSDDRSRGPGNQGLIAFQSSDGTTVQGCASTADNDRATLSTAQLGQIFAAGLGHPTNLNLGEFGSYRLVASQGTLNSPSTGSQVSGTVVVGLPTAPVDRTIGRTIGIVLASVIAGLLVVAIAGLLIVRRSLRPLDRVAATATRVSRLPLDRGQVALAERVPEADTDVRTEVGQVGAALNEMLDHVDEALQSRQQSEERVRQFVADASHELRTPLASIRGYAELTRREREPVPETVTHAIGRIESEGKRMSSLVEDLLLLARLDAGRPLESDTVDLTEMIVNAVSDAHAASPGHTWQLDLPDEPVEVRGDGPRLHQIVANLLANARTHTDPGTVVRTTLARRGDHVLISVHDDGPGVPQSLQANVFARFARGDTSRNRAGGSTGLGLSIVSAVVQAHGGTVTLTSVPGDTTFTVTLPA